MRPRWIVLTDEKGLEILVGRNSAWSCWAARAWDASP